MTALHTYSYIFSNLRIYELYALLISPHGIVQEHMLCYEIFHTVMDVR